MNLRYCRVALLGVTALATLTMSGCSGVMADTPSPTEQRLLAHETESQKRYDELFEQFEQDRKDWKDRLEQEEARSKELHDRVVKLEERTLAMSKKLRKPELPKRTVAVVDQSVEPLSAPPRQGPRYLPNFTDIAGKYGEKEIHHLSQLEVFHFDGEFRPHNPVSRGQYIAWLVRSNNAIYKNDPKKQIRLAQNGDQTFKDVPLDHPYYPYIQGMVDAGFVIGYTEDTFKPKRALSREELVAIKAGRCYAPNAWKYGWSSVVFKDKEKISPRYRVAFCQDAPKKGWITDNVFGNNKVFRPKKAVTRAEAAISVWAMGRRNADTAANALAKR